MRLEALRVAHRSRKSAGVPLQGVDSVLPGAFFLETCQRQLWVFHSELTVSSDISGVHVLSGEQAYAFLLRVATGLESEVAGETDIFGQLKAAWHVYELQNFPFLKFIQPWMQRVFEDTKEIRTLYLQNINTGSYGSLVRKLLAIHVEDASKERVLLVGAGHLAQSVAPWLLDHPVTVLNRTRSSAERLVNDVLSKLPHDHRKPQIEIADQESTELWSQAAHVVICVPLDAEGDLAKVSALKSQTVIHLGGISHECRAWSERLNRFYSLSDLFAIQQKQDEKRKLAIDRALEACATKARLRVLSSDAGGSIALPHGWEDLAVFA